MGYSINEQGALVRMVEEEVNESEVEQQLQEELDAAQNELNTHNANLANSEQEMAQLEAQADAKHTEIEGHQANVEAAQARLDKSQADSASLAAARAVRDERAGADAEEADDSDADGDDESAESEEQAVPVNVVAAEG